MALYFLDADDADDADYNLPCGADLFSGVQECRSDASLRSADDSAACMMSPSSNFSDADDADSFCFSESKLLSEFLKLLNF